MGEKMKQNKTKQKTKGQKDQKEQENTNNTDNTMAQNSYLSVFTLNVSALNTPIKRHRVTEWIRKQDPSICCL